MLAGVSVTYYTRLEQGQSVNASDSVIEALARALCLDTDERAHLRDLARPTPPKRWRTPPPVSVRARTRTLIDAMGDVPAVLMGRSSEVLAWNRLGHSLVAGHVPFDDAGTGRQPSGHDRAPQDFEDVELTARGI